MIKEYFNKEFLKAINSDEIIAYGATIVTCIESRIVDEELKIIVSIGIEFVDE